MRRWNGWGDDSIEFHLPDSAAHYIAQVLGEGPRIQDASLAQTLTAIPDSRTQPHPLLTTEPLERLTHARGQSLPDWIALRAGRIGTFPDAVAYPTTDEEVRALVRLASHTASRLIPYGGGTSVVGHINPLPGQHPVMTVDMRRMNRLLDLDETSRLATFEAGVIGPHLEEQLRPRGFTLGHFPQSFEYSTLGGWIAARSSGQQSYHYGRIESLFAGGCLESPLGALDLPALPASAAGPDLRQAILGSEGRLGIITRAAVRVRPAPETESFQAVFFRDWASGAQAVRTLAQERVPVSMLRLSDALETEVTLALSGRDRLVRWADCGLRLAGYGPQRSLMLFGVTGDRGTTDHAQRITLDLARSHGGLPVGTAIGNQWRKSRFRSPYLRNRLWERGYALDTLETALPWSKVLPAAEAIKAAVRSGLEADGEHVLVFAHLSHVYDDGASL
jgi:alkyldihydroxyacetonephosphate synthase